MMKMEDLVNYLTMDEVIELHDCCQKLMEHQITESGNDWIVILNRDIGLDIIFKWAVFIGRAIGEDFRNEEFKLKARKLSGLIQHRFSQIGLDISLWSPVFFYLGMIYTYAKFIGFVKIYHNQSQTKLDVISRIDPTFADMIRVDREANFIFIDSRKEDPINISDEIIKTGLLDVTKVEVFIGNLNTVPESYLHVPELTIHHIDRELELDLKGTVEFSSITYWNKLLY